MMPTEIYLTKFLGIGLTAITIFVFTSSVSDPVNAPKFLILGLVALGALSNLSLSKVRSTYKRYKITSYLLAIVILAMVIATTFSHSPLVQNIYGTQGRNTGLLTYIACCIIFFTILSLTNLRSMKLLLASLFISGLINLLYCAWVLLFGDFIGWNNPYKSILGTFGNPNFVSSFLAICLIAFIPFLYSKRKSWLHLVLGLGIMILAIYEIWKSNSIQGFILVVLGLFLGVLSSTYYSSVPRSAFFGLVLAGAISTFVATLGALGKGPLGGYLFQETFVYRMEYWRAGVNMGMKFPFTGVGMDSYGDWYRELRTAESMVSPGAGVITNVAHNIYIDYFASGGFLLLVPILGLQVVAIISIVRFFKTSTKFDPYFSAIAFGWLGFQAQALISINQIGIAIWGWVLTALIINYSKISQIEKTSFHPKAIRDSQVLGNGLKTFVGISIGFIIFLPPMQADRNWTTAYATRDATKIQKSLDSNYFNPSNSYTLVTAVQIFENSNLHNQALEIAINAVKFNPRSYDSWLMLSALKNTPEGDRKKAESYLLKLDPRNTPTRKISE